MERPGDQGREFWKMCAVLSLSLSPTVPHSAILPHSRSIGKATSHYAPDAAMHRKPPT